MLQKGFWMQEANNCTYFNIIYYNLCLMFVFILVALLHLQKNLLQAPKDHQNNLQFQSQIGLISGEEPIISINIILQVCNNMLFVTKHYYVLLYLGTLQILFNPISKARLVESNCSFLIRVQYIILLWILGIYSRQRNQYNFNN